MKFFEFTSDGKIFTTTSGPPASAIDGRNVPEEDKQEYFRAVTEVAERCISNYAVEFKIRFDRRPEKYPYNNPRVIKRDAEIAQEESVANSNCTTMPSATGISAEHAVNHRSSQETLPAQPRLVRVT